MPTTSSQPLHSRDSQTAAQNWPVAIVTLPGGATEEDTLRLTQAAIDVGALGGQTGAGLLQIYLPREADEIAARKTIESALRAEAEALGWPDPETKPSIKWDSLPDAPWTTAWQADFKLLPVGERLLIRPDWEKGMPIPPDFQTREVFYIKPGSGFGTARHETTRLALELLEQWLQSGSRVLDFGTGSGILAIAAARLGAEKVIAIDNDPQALVNAHENIELNGMQERIELVESPSPNTLPAAYNLIICNMLPHEAHPHWEALVSLLARTSDQTSKHSHLIFSGLLADQKEEVEAQLQRHGLYVRAWAQADEWVAGVFGIGRG